MHVLLMYLGNGINKYLAFHGVSLENNNKSFKICQNSNTISTSKDLIESINCLFLFLFFLDHDDPN